MTHRIAEYSRPGHFLIHLSDTHFLANGRLYDAVDSESELSRLLTRLVESGARPDAIVITGDLADKGEPGAYAALRAMLEPVAEHLGARLVWVMGNHDERSAFRSELLDDDPGSEPIDRVDYVNGLRIVTLDTSVPGAHHGALERSQLDWLAAVLAEPAPHGTILAMHHPPVPCVLDLAVTVELRDQRELAEVLTGTDVRSIIAGHLHYSTTATFAGIPVSVASATCYTQDLAAPVGSTRPRDGAQSYNLVHVYEHTVMHSVVAAGDYPLLGFVSAAETESILAADGIVLPSASVLPSVSIETDIRTLERV